MTTMNEQTANAWPARTLPAMVAPVEQKSVAWMYDPKDALLHGTLFPALWKPMCNRPLPIPACPVDAVSAIQFTLWELRLYLDTHPLDCETWQYLRETYGKQQADGYASAFLTGCDEAPAADAQGEGRCYPWANEPWPWEEIYCDAPVRCTKGGNRCVCL